MKIRYRISMEGRNPVQQKRPTYAIFYQRKRCRCFEFEKNVINTVCPTRYRTRHFFNNITTNEDIAAPCRNNYAHYRHTLQTHSSSFLTQRTYSFSNFVAISSLVIDQKQLENVERFKYLGSMLTNDGRGTCEIKSRIAMAKAAFNKKKNHLPAHWT